MGCTTLCSCPLQKELQPYLDNCGGISSWEILALGMGLPARGAQFAPSEVVSGCICKAPANGGWRADTGKALEQL